jgi:hypothetical protein
MTNMNEEKLFIRLFPRIRKQLEILEEKDEYSYYETLGLNRDFSPDDLTRSINRSRELLERLKFHPQYKDESQAVLERLFQAVEILDNPATRMQYDAALQTFYQEGKDRQNDKFRHLVEITLQGERVGPAQKKALLSYAIQRKIEIESAQSILDSFASQDQDSALLVASPPRLSAPIPRFMETPAFQIILHKSQPFMEQLYNLRCSCCGKENPVTHLICSCGSLMRGKMICLGCSLLFSIKDSQCPNCGKESQVMLEPSEGDLLKIHNNIQAQTDRQENDIAMNACRDILEILPGDHKIRTTIQDLQQKHQAQEVRQEKKNIEDLGIQAFEENKIYKAYKLLNRTSQSDSLSEKARDILKKSSLILASKINRISFFLLLISFIFFVTSVIIYESDILQNESLEQLILYGFLVFFGLSSSFRFYFTLIFKKSLEKSSGSKSSPKNE